MRRALLALAALAATPAAAEAAPSPPGANDLACRPTAERPAPVVLVHGAFLDQSSWNALAPILRRDGFCVFSLDLAQGGTELAAFARTVLDHTGAAKVSFVGHSTGALLARMVVRDGLLDRTEDVVSLAPAAAPDGGDQAPAPVDWTTIATRHDGLVPVEAQALRGSGGLRNVVLQDRCAEERSDHVALPSSAVAIQWARNALRREGPASAGFVPDCTGRSLGADPEQSARATAAGRPAAFLGVRALVRGGALLVGLQCNGAADRKCLSHAVARAGGRRLGDRRITLHPGQRAALAIRLPAAARRTLARRGRLAVTVRVTTRKGSPRAVARRYVVRSG